MVTKLMNSYMELLSRYIYDDDKLVTYKWLSKELELHVNTAKQILWEFSQQPCNQGKFEATFLLVGYLKDGGMRVEIVKQSNLSVAKEKFSRITSEHLYSLQKSLPDIGMLAITGEGDCRYSSIVCKESVVRSDEELFSLRWGVSFSNQLPATLVKVIDPTGEGMVRETRDAQTSGTSDAPPSVANSDGERNGALGNVFEQSSDRQKTKTLLPSNVKAGKNEKTSIKGEGTKAGKRISPAEKAQKNKFNSFFSKAVNRSENSNSLLTVKAVDNESSKNCSPDTIKDVPASNKLEEVKEKPRPPESLIPEDDRARSDTVYATEEKLSERRTSGKKRNRSADVDSAAKRRKRIVVVSDSSEDSCTSEEEREPSPVLTESHPVKNSTPSPPSVGYVRGKRKVRRVVDETFMDKDGYLVTRKVDVYETCPEEEQEEEEEVEIAEAKSSAKPEAKTEAKSKKTTKQTTLTSFFKKP